jgi:guanylate kinase
MSRSIRLAHDLCSPLYQGVKSLKRTSLQPFYLFIAPPSIKALRERLQGRGTESDDAVESRLKAAITEIEYARQPDIYEAVVVNDDLDRAYEIFRGIALGERTDGDHMPSLDS